MNTYTQSIVNGVIHSSLTTHSHYWVIIIILIPIICIYAVILMKSFKTFSGRFPHKKKK